MPDSDTREQELEAKWSQLVEDIVDGRVSIIDVLKCEENNYYDHIMRSRTFFVLMRDQRVVNRLNEETKTRLEKELGGKRSLHSINQDIQRKDGVRRFTGMVEIWSESYKESPSLLTGKDFDECLQQYLGLLEHTETIFDDACTLYHQGHFPLCTFISILLIEEVGKLSRLWMDLLNYDTPAESSNEYIGMIGRSHRKKHILGVMAGAIINSRLDRILGHKRINRLLQDTESGKLESLRQACLYVDMVDGVAVTPKQRIDEATARFYVTLAGELWAEILGHFPWEFEKMLGKVVKFELSIGYPEEIVNPQ